jgi:hypothetical protein
MLVSTRDGKDQKNGKLKSIMPYLDAQRRTRSLPVHINSSYLFTALQSRPGAIIAPATLSSNFYSLRIAVVRRTPLNKALKEHIHGMAEFPGS